MKRASSLTVLNMGGTAAADHFQVRSPAPLTRFTCWLDLPHHCCPLSRACGLPHLHPLHVGWPFPTAATLSAEPVGILVFLIQDTQTP